MESNIYEPFEIAHALGFPLLAPKNSFVYIAKAYDSTGNLNFSGAYSSYEAGLEDLYMTAIESLELLDTLAPWAIAIEYLRFDENVSPKEYNKAEGKAKHDWLKLKSREEVISSYYSTEEGLYYEKNWEIKKRLMK